MAYIHTEIVIEAAPEVIWNAARDVGALHTRLVPGFVTDTRMEGDARIVTFGSGTVARERIVGIDDQMRRVAWSITTAPFDYHHGALQIFPRGVKASRVVWTADVLPDGLADAIKPMMEKGLAVMKGTFESFARER